MTMLRREGIMRLVQAGVVKFRQLDRKGKYVLLATDFGMNGGPVAGMYLKMQNPTTKEVHIEGVPNSFTTVSEALNWRNHGWFFHADKQT